MVDVVEAPTVSIIMRSYNRAKTIRRAIESVLAQDFADWELIVVDDGSNDDTAGIASSYNDARIRIKRHEKNKGQAAALNTGLDNIRGEWFTLLDSDDEMVTPNALSTLLSVPEKIDPTITAITCNCIDTQTGEFSGSGLESQQYLDGKNVHTKMQGGALGIDKDPPSSR